MTYFPPLALMVFDAFRTSDMFNRAVVLSLVALSVYAIIKIHERFSVFSLMRRWDGAVLSEYRKYAHPSGAKLSGLRKFRGAPVSEIYEAVTDELSVMLRQHGMSSAEVNEWEPGMDAVELGAGDLGKLRVTAERALSEQIASVERNLTSIATCASMAPSIGLFGTVWGVMGSFMTMADGGGAAMISSVAPGISGALLTTVLGLLVAIPSGYFYNRLSDAAREIVSDAENFTDELLADIGRIHGRQ